MAGVKKEDQLYLATVSVAKGILRALLYVAIILAIFVASKTAYNFGYMIFDQSPLTTEGAGKDVTLEITGDESAYQIGKMLEENEIISYAEVFWVQEKLSDYHGKIKPGTYIVNSAQSTEEILCILSQEAVEE